AQPPAAPAASAPAAKGARASAKRAATGAKRAPATKKAALLDEDEGARRRWAARRYAMRGSHAAGDWPSRPTFGVGRVEEGPEAQAMLVLFEDGERRQMVQGRG